MVAHLQLLALDVCLCDAFA
ncbi:DUF645 family protein [Vibrio cholerae]|nr:DUF645 family protein [Vibrio cholerae]MBJ6922861.1 DUF645 family protein [Vibrio cholerae]MEB5521737.1 DUF645 family protein [Vibrio cholerae]